ncbi:hypothetical protein CTheo_9254 [Ceratobasidium theobromae]|uniref:Uncharacterized protein n=1 Tax=Ceratobasidium theobromae TaxID=1582974 RepID=A0A5N5Q5Y7_9AGAM|nr:hypothetical protein CTheo_9254 [Ceratobasidium theobromae]
MGRFILLGPIYCYLPGSDYEDDNGNAPDSVRHFPFLPATIGSLFSSLPLSSPNNEGRTDIWEETFDILTLSNESPTQVDTGEGPVPIWSEEYVSGWDGEADDSWGQAEWDNEAWGVQQEFGHVEPTVW